MLVNLRHGSTGDTLLHVSCRYRPDVDVIKGLIEKFRLVVKATTNLNGTLLAGIQMSIDDFHKLLDFLVLQYKNSKGDNREQYIIQYVIINSCIFT